MNSLTLEHSPANKIEYIKQQIQKKQDEVAFLLGKKSKFRKQFPRPKVSSSILIQGPIATLEDTIVQHQKKLLFILDSEDQYTALIHLLFEVKKQLLKTREWNKATVVSEGIDGVMPYWWSSFISFPVTLLNYKSQKKLIELLELFYNEIKVVEEKNPQIESKHIQISKNLILGIDIFETIVEFLSIFSMPLKAGDVGLSGLKIYFSYKNKEKIQNIGLSLDKTVEDLILFLEQKKSLT